MSAVTMLFPVGRMVMGSLYRAETKDADGKPLVYKTGADAGKPRVKYFFAVAIPKAGEQHWNQTVWGQQIWIIGSTASPAVHQRPDFAWKIQDGDSTMPNKKGNKLSDREGCPGHWIVSFNSTYAPQIWAHDGKQYVSYDVLDAIKCGYYVQVKGSVEANRSEQNPGVYINPNAVAFIDVGAVIVTGENPDEIGFAPQRAAIPVASNPMAVPAATPAPAVPMPIVPNPAILTAGLPPAPPPAAPVRNMTAKAAGLTYDAYIAGGWNDATLIAHGYMIA